MRVLVTGSAGMLGRAVVEALADDHEVSGVDLPDGDLTVARDVTALFERYRPQWTIHTAAYTDVDGAESDRPRAESVNGRATVEVAGACDATGAGLTYVSTDYVFAGVAADGYAEDDARDPVNAYGETKAAGEVAVEGMSGPRQIVRTSWLFGPGPRNFVLTIRRLLAGERTLRVVDDQRGCPTYAPDLAQVLAFLLQARPDGVFHATNSGACTWYEFAREIARQSGADPDRIEPCGSDAYPTPARRPRCSVLASRNLEVHGCPARPPWQDALARYIAWLDERSHEEQGG